MLEGTEGCSLVLGRVGLGLQPDPSRRQIPKTQALLRVSVVAGSRGTLVRSPRGPVPWTFCAPSVSLPARLALGVLARGWPR